MCGVEKSYSNWFFFVKFFCYDYHCYVKKFLFICVTSRKYKTHTFLLHKKSENADIIFLQVNT